MYRAGQIVKFHTTAPADVMLIVEIKDNIVIYKVHDYMWFRLRRMTIENMLIIIIKNHILYSDIFCYEDNEL